MGGNDKAPAPIDPVEAIRAQAEANRVNLSSPFGGQRYSQGPDGQWTLESYLSPELQGIADQMMGRISQGPQQFGIPGYDQLMGNVMQQVGGHFQGGDRRGLGSMGSGIGSPKPMGGQSMPVPQMGAQPQMGAPQGQRGMDIQRLMMGGG